MSVRIRIAAAVLAASPLLAGVPALAQSTTSSLSSAKVAPSDRMFVLKAGASDKFEIDSAKLVQDSSNPQIVSFAQQMITDHTKSTDMVRQAAMADGMTVKPPVMDKMQVSMLGKLRASKGTARDSLYLTQQKVSHQKALDLMQTFAAQGKSANLKQAAAQITPVVQSHVDMLAQMPAATGM